MKFARSYQHCLNNLFPPTWVDSAISYKKLKKCIRRVQGELDELGLQDMISTPGSPPTRDVSLHAVDCEGSERFSTRISDESGRSTLLRWDYTLTVCEAEQCCKSRLMVAVIGDSTYSRIWWDNTLNGHESCRFLSKLASVQDSVVLNPYEEKLEVKLHSGRCVESLSSSSTQTGDSSRILFKARVPLNADAEFFSILYREILAIAAFQECEANIMEREIQRLGQIVQLVSTPTFNGHNTQDLEIWRQILQLYVDSQVFQSSPRYRGTCSIVSEGNTTGSTPWLDSTGGVNLHDYDHARAAWKHFLTHLNSLSSLGVFKVRGSREALQSFLQVNTRLLRALHFQHLNEAAFRKILKKFNKRTAFGRQVCLPESVVRILDPCKVSRSVCNVMFSALVGRVPLLSDFTCPVCFGIRFLPVRLPCQHIFCMHCIMAIHLRTATTTSGKPGPTRCPLCRRAFPYEAVHTYVDRKHARWLRKWFRKETKEKQRDDKNGPVYDFTLGAYYRDPCITM